MEVQINYTRPDKIKQYAKQVEFIDSPHRFTFVEATSKAGKTVGCIVWLFEQAVSPYGWFYPDPDGLGFVTSKVGRVLDKRGYNYWWVAPTYTVAKIAYRRMKRMISAKDIFQVNESELMITLVNGATLFFKGADKPDTLYGEDVFAVVIDEASRTKKDSRIAVFSTLTATDGLMKAIGNVKGNKTWFYEYAHKAKNGEISNSAYYLITAKDAIDAGVLEQRVIDEAEEQLAKADFLELYHGIPNVKASNQYAYAFDENKHVRSCNIDIRYPVWLSFDFNVNPISCTVIQHINGRVKIPWVLQIGNSNIYELCKLIKTKFLRASFMVTGDATGKNTNAMVRDNLNYFRIIRTELGLSRGQLKVLSSNPPTDQNQVLVNAVLEHIPHDIDPSGAGKLIDDFNGAKVDERGKLLKKNRDDENQKLEALDGYRYWVNLNLRGQLKGLRHL